MPILLKEVTSTKRNVLEVKMRFDHGDADATTYDTYNFEIPIEKVHHLERIISMIQDGSEWFCREPYLAERYSILEDDWNESNSNDDGIKIGAKLWFVKKAQQSWNNQYVIGTLSSIDDKGWLHIDYKGTDYIVKDTPLEVAPEASIPIVDPSGSEIDFEIDGININISCQGDCTVDGQFPADGSIDEIYYYDNVGTKFSVES